MVKTRPYISAFDYVMLSPDDNVPVFWNNQRIKAIRMCRLHTQKPKCTVTFADKSATIIDARERLYFDAR